MEEGRGIGREGQHGRGSGRVAAVDGIESEAAATTTSFGQGDDDGEQHGEKSDNHDDEHLQRPAWKRVVAHIGPGFLVSMAYLDPSNLLTDLQAGANHRYELLWVVLIGLIFVLMIQSFAANLGVVTGRHLAELCKSEYPKYVKYCLWFLAQVAVIAATIPEVLGAAFAYDMLFHIPLWAGVLITGSSTLLLLGLQSYGARKLELLISILVLVIAACFFRELSNVKPPSLVVIEGLLVPRLKGHEATADAIALLAALIMPHNLFLHSALVLSRETQSSTKGIKDASRFFLLDSGFTLFIALLINIVVVSVSGTICAANDLSLEDANTCSSLTLNSTSVLLKNVLGKSSSTVYAVALLASGQSSAITTTYSGQYIMQGFFDLRTRKWLINLIARCVALTPGLIICIIGGIFGVGQLITIAAMILSFELPFAIVPLLKFSSSSTKMGPHKNSAYIAAISWLLGTVIIGINIYFLSTSFVSWLVHSNLPRIANAVISILVFPLMAAYIAAVLYLAFRKVTVVTFPSGTVPCKIEVERTVPQDGKSDNPTVPCREDLTDFPLPM